MSRTLAPSGTPIHFRDLANCIAHVGRNPIEELKKQLREKLGVEQVFLFATGRGAMTFLLHSMQAENTDSARKYVVVPSYTCYSVAASVLKSGLDVLVCDIDPDSLCFSPEQLKSIDFSEVLAVVNTSLYGMPSQMEQVQRTVADSGAYLVDDAAQSFGATYADRPSGSFGDAGILSFDKGKVVTSINGGAIVSNNTALSRRFELEYAKLSSSSMTSRLMDLVKLNAYFLMLNPSLYWIPSNLPFLKLGETRYDESFEVARYFGAMAPLVNAQIRRIDEMNQHRRRCASAYDRKIGAASHLVRIAPGRNSDPNYLRFPLRISNPEFRRRFLADFRSLGCSISYPQCLADVPEIRDRIRIQNDSCDGGRTIAAELVTLPTHAYVTDDDIELITAGLLHQANSLSHDTR